MNVTDFSSQTTNKEATNTVNKIVMKTPDNKALKYPSVINKSSFKDVGSL